MRIWYQSTVDLSRNKRYAEVLLERAQEILGKETTVELHGSELSDGKHLVSTARQVWEFLRALHGADHNDLAAVVIGNGLDPGLMEARELLTIPIVGLGEVSMRVAADLGSSFGVVVVDKRYTWRMRELISRYGMDRLLAGIAVSTYAVPDLDRGLDDPGLLRQLADRFFAACEPLIERGAEVIVPASGLVPLTLHRAGVHDVHGVPIVDTVAASLLAARFWSDLFRVSATGGGAAGTAARLDPALRARIFSTP